MLHASQEVALCHRPAGFQDAPWSSSAPRGRTPRKAAGTAVERCAAIVPVHQGIPEHPPFARTDDWREKKSHLPSGCRPQAFQKEARDIANKTKGATSAQPLVEAAAAAI